VITRGLGVTQFGILSIFLAAQQYFIMLVEYGFTLTGARDISRSSDKNDENNILSEILACRFLIFIFSSMLVFATYLFLPEYGYAGCYLILLFTVLSSVCNQTHFFIGKERTGFIVISTSVTRVVSILIVIFFVKDKEDIYIAMLAYSMNVALPNIVSTIYLKYSLNYKTFRKLHWIEYYQDSEVVLIFSSLTFLLMYIAH
jgi:PST family polysaccharide transporter